MTDFCGQCAGPYPTDKWPGSQYAGHWDTCPNRPKGNSMTNYKRGDQVRLTIEGEVSVGGGVVITGLGDFPMATLSSVNATIELIELTVAQQIEKLPVGTRFIRHFKNGDQDLSWRVDGGWVIRRRGSIWAVDETQATRIEVIPE